MNEEELLTELTEQNPWWRDGKIKLKDNLIIRDIYPQLINELKSKQITGLIGLRQIGKTTLLKQQINHLLKNNINKKNILYFSFDSIKEENIIKKIISLYFSRILKKPAYELKDTIYLFFDEVQKIKDWSDDLKSFYDKEYPLKIYISGSSSMNILKGSGESLIGRINIHKIYPFSFGEYLKYNGMQLETISLDNIKYPVEAEKIKILFEEYLKIGGLPGLYGLEEVQLKQAIKTMIDLTFYRDIVNMFNIKRTDIMEGLFYCFVKNSGNTLNYNNLSISLKTKFETIKTYIDYLNTSFMIQKSLFFSQSTVKTFEKNPKVYVADNAFFLLNGTKMGLIVETCVFNHLLKYESRLSYWQDKKNKEVDIIVGKKSPLPIEVKYRSNIRKEDFQNILFFMEEYKIKKGIVVTKNCFEEQKINGRKILFIPAWIFLMSEGIHSL